MNKKFENIIVFVFLDRRLEQCPDRALLVWSPTADISDSKCKVQVYAAKKNQKYKKNISKTSTNKYFSGRIYRIG